MAPLPHNRRYSPPVGLVEPEAILRIGKVLKLVGRLPSRKAAYGPDKAVDGFRKISPQKTGSDWTTGTPENEGISDPWTTFAIMWTYLGNRDFFSFLDSRFRGNDTLTYRRRPVCSSASALVREVGGA